MKKALPAAQARKSFVVTPHMQIAFVCIAFFAWITNIISAMINIGAASQFMSWANWASLYTDWALPILLLVIALPFVWRHYQGTLVRLSVATALSLVGQIMTNGFMSLEMSVRYRWFFSLRGSDSSGVWNLVGHQWLVVVLSVALYTGGLGLWEWNITRRAKH